MKRSVKDRIRNGEIDSPEVGPRRDLERVLVASPCAEKHYSVHLSAPLSESAPMPRFSTWAFHPLLILLYITARSVRTYACLWLLPCRVSPHHAALHSTCYCLLEFLPKNNGYIVHGAAPNLDIEILSSVIAKQKVKGVCR